MLISDSRRLLFVHVQKTGGSTIDRTFTAALGDVRRIPELDRHARLGEILGAEPQLASYWTVGFVRNPWARLVSWHRMVLRFQAAAEEGNENKARLVAGNRFLRTVARDYPDFEDFVMRAPEQFPRLRRPQVSYLFAKGGRRADLVGRQETLDEDVRAIAARLDLEIEELSVVNVDRERPDHRDLYTDAMRRRVEEMFAADIAAFDYRF